MRPIFIAVLCGVALLPIAPAAAPAMKDCHIGSYRLADGRAVDIAPSAGDRAYGNIGWNGSVLQADQPSATSRRAISPAFSGCSQIPSEGM